MSGLDSLLSELSSVINTKATKGGITEQEIMRDYNMLCGKKVEYAKHGYRSLGDLLSSHPEKFSRSGDRWYGKVTEDNENIIRSMATEKSKRGRGAPRARFFGQGSRPITPRNAAGPSSFPRVDSQPPSFFPRGDPHPISFFPRGNPAPFGRTDSPRFHQSSSDGVLQNSDEVRRTSDRKRDNASPMVATEGGWKTTQKMPAKTGFGNKSFNYVPSDTASTCSRSASVDTYRDEDDELAPPPGLNDARPNSVRTEQFPESHPESFRGMVARDVPTPEYPPGLSVEGGEDEAHAPLSDPPRSESFRGVVANNVDAPAYPPGLSHEDVEKQPAAPPASSPMSSGKKELSESERTNLDIAQKTYDLLKQSSVGMTVKEIAEKIKLPEIKEGINARAQVGGAVLAHMGTFSLSSMNSDGIVEIIRGAPRPGSGMFTNEGVPTKNTETISSRSSPNPPRNYNNDVVFKPPRRDSVEYMDERLIFDRDDAGKFPWLNDDFGDQWDLGVPESENRPVGNSRFSVPTSSGGPRRQPPDTFSAPRREERFVRPPPSPPGFSSAHKPFYDSQEEMNRGDYWKRDDVGQSRTDRSDEHLSYETWKNKSRDHSAHWQPPRASSNSDRFPQYADDSDIDRPRRRLGAPPEPKKFERKHKYLTNSTEVPRYESVKLTHFVALDEFYVRSCKEENRYQDMLAKLREDYKGALEDAVPQLWMKGDGAAVWYERRWQRAVVRRPVTSTSVANVELFLIDVGKTVTVSTEQVVPLHEYYHVSPFAFCCTIGCFDIVPGRRKAFLDECDDMAACFAEAVDDDLEIQTIERFWDETEKMKVRLIYRDQERRKDIQIPRYFVDEELITLR